MKRIFIHTYVRVQLLLSDIQFGGPIKFSVQASKKAYQSPQTKEKNRKFIA
jgi:hypothetical protein